MTASVATRAYPLNRNTVAPFDFILALTVAAILLLGSIMVFSSGVAGGPKEFEFRTAHLIKHVIHISIGLVGLMVMARFLSLDWLQRNSKLFLLLGMLALAVLLVPGVGLDINGSTRWLSIAGLRIQPAEVVKLACIIYIADYYARKQGSVHLFKVGVLNIGIPILMVAAMLLLEPDFGTTVVIIALTGAMMFLAGVRLRVFTLVVLVGVAAMALIAVLEPYRMARLTVYLNPWDDPFDKGFQLTQALMAVGRGGWFGVGLGNSLQKLNYLPHADNDFLIAIIAEELGAVGVMAVMGLFGILLWRAFTIAGRALQLGQRFGAYLAYGIGLMLVFNAIIHVGVNTGILPTKGLTLPLMSAGGSSMIISLVALGMLFAVDRRSRIPTPRRRRRT